MEEIVRGTTPTIKYTFSTINTSNLTVAKLVIQNTNDSLVEKDLSAATIGTGYIQWVLPQSDTLALPDASYVTVKLDWLLNDGTRGIGKTIDLKVSSSAVNEVISG